MKKGISVSILAYKEEDNLKKLLPEIIDILDILNEEYEINIIDTEKPLDNTEEVCKKYGCNYINQYYPAFGGAFRVAIESANYDKFLILDGDGSHLPKYIKDMYNRFISEDCDIVIGSRYVKGGKTDDAKSSIIMSKILNTVFRISLGIKAHDISTDYRIYKTEQLKAVTLQNENYDILQEVLLKMKLNNKYLKISEVPIYFQKRLYGESKRRLIPFIISYFKSLIRLSSLRFPLISNFILYIVFGLMGAVVDMLSFAALLLINSNVVVSSLCSGIIGFILTFFLNTFYNFRKTDKIKRRFLLYGFFCLIGIGISTCIINIFKNSVEIYSIKFCLLCVTSLIQFFLNRYITFR